jgi:hypothetical protein
MQSDAVQELKLSLVEPTLFCAPAALDIASQRAETATMVAKFRFITFPPILVSVFGGF